ncbi:MAG: hypothetical protein VXY93_17485, partial [Pseudomonadota bacterium]|nr:hypothetical protein [Pseudomonadota bacterium]
MSGNLEVGRITASNYIRTSSQLQIFSTNPTIVLADTDSENDFNIKNNNGVFTVQDADSSIDRFKINSSGQTTITGDLDISRHLDVDGHTDLDNVSIAGVVTATTIKGALEATSASFSSNIDANGDLDVDGHTNLDNVNISGVATVGNLTVSGSSLQAVNGAFSNNITANQGTFGGNITGPLLSISPGSGDDGIILLNSAGGQNNDFSRIRQ